MNNLPPRSRTKCKRKIRWSRVFLLLILLFIFVASVGGAAVYTYRQLYPAQPTAAGASSNEVITKRVNVLLLGLDDGDSENVNAPKRSDTMILASINPEDKSIMLISIPRDTRLNIPGQKGLDKINHAHAYGGPKLAKKTVETLLGIPVHYYVSIDWQGFIKVIDIIGGVDLYVERDMHYTDPYANLEIDLEKGYQHLDGKKAGQYVRFRTDELGDIGRVQRQQRFLKALADNALKLGTLWKLPSLVSTINEYVETDMTIMTMIKIANSVKTFSNGGLKAEMLPGKFGTVQGISYWLPDEKQIKTLIEPLKI